MPQNKVLTIIGWVLTVALSGMLFVSAYTKLAKIPQAVDGFKQAGYPDSALVPIGVAEIISTILFLIPHTRVLGAVLLTGYLGGAINHHVRMGEGFIVQALFGVVVWLALFFRDTRIRSILPIYQSASVSESNTSAK